MEITLGTIADRRVLRGLAIAWAPFALVLIGVGIWSTTLGVDEVIWWVFTRMLVAIGMAYVVLAALLLSRHPLTGGAAIGPDGVEVGGQVVGWSQVDRPRLRHNRGRPAVAAQVSGRPVWLGLVDSASAPVDEIVRSIEKWSGQRVER